MTRNKHTILSLKFPRTKSIAEGPQMWAIQYPGQSLEEEKLFIATGNSVDFLVESSMFPTGSDWQQLHARLELSLFGRPETTLPHDLASKKAGGKRASCERTQKVRMKCAAVTIGNHQKCSYAIMNYRWRLHTNEYNIRWQNSNKTDLVSKVNKTMIFAINHTQVDGSYCVRFWNTHIWSFRNSNESFSDRMQIFLVPPGNCFCNWNHFVIVESFHMSTAYPHIHPNPYPHPHMNYP